MGVIQYKLCEAVIISAETVEVHKHALYIYPVLSTALKIYVLENVNWQVPFARTKEKIWIPTKEG